jgi:hypothetical protein
VVTPLFPLKAHARRFDKLLQGRAAAAVGPNGGVGRVQKPGFEVTALKIDDAILAVAQPSWRKVAMIIVKAAERLGSVLPEGEDGYRLVARRIKALVRDGHLVAQGDVSKWRYSEVRLP